MYEWGKAFRSCNKTLKDVTFLVFLITLVIASCTGTFQMSNTNTCTYFFQPSLVKMLSMKNVKMLGLGKKC